MKSNAAILKLPLIVAAVVVVVRVIVERVGAPESVTNLLSIAAMHTVIDTAGGADGLLRKDEPDSWSNPVSATHNPTDDRPHCVHSGLCYLPGPHARTDRACDRRTLPRSRRWPALSRSPPAWWRAVSRLTRQSFRTPVPW